jgi:hypothetical protein
VHGRQEKCISFGDGRAFGDRPVFGNERAFGDGRALNVIAGGNESNDDADTRD